jgi:hypothetical protein
VEEAPFGVPFGVPFEVPFEVPFGVPFGAPQRGDARQPRALSGPRRSGRTVVAGREPRS